MRTYNETHAKRWELSLEALRPHLSIDTRVLELGGVGPFSEMLHRICDLVHVYDLDLTQPFSLQLPRDYDVVVCMEVLEHIHDVPRPEGFSHMWEGTGTANLLREACAHLRPGGLLFLTTPNASSLNVLHKVLHLQPPMVYRPHVREYGPHELAALVKAAGFERITVTSCDPWADSMSQSERGRIAKAIAELGYRTDCRGEDLFLTAYKPDTQPL